jgi:hypothetical protein
MHPSSYALGPPHTHTHAVMHMATFWRKATALSKAGSVPVPASVCQCACACVCLLVRISVPPLLRVTHANEQRAPLYTPFIGHLSPPLAPPCMCTVGQCACTKDRACASRAPLHSPSLSPSLRPSHRLPVCVSLALLKAVGSTAGTERWPTLSSSTAYSCRAPARRNRDQSHCPCARQTAPRRACYCKC